MEISNAHNQAMAAHQLEEVLAGIGCPNYDITTDIDHHLHKHQQQEQEQEQEKEKEKENEKTRLNPEKSLKCPRCDSTNTKFCYYNNYSLSQPRYFCKGCRRYWTHGGSLRNVPVGGGCRKSNNKRSSNSKKSRPLNIPQPPPPLSYNPNHDLSFAFATLHSNTFLNPNPNPNPNPNSWTANFLDILGFDRVAYDYMEGGGGGGNMLLPFEGGDLNLAAEGSWIGHGNGNEVGVETTSDYRNNGVGNSYWNGLVNSYLM